MLALLAAFAATSAYAGNSYKDLAGFTELDEVTDFTYSGSDYRGWGWNFNLVKATSEEGGTKNIYGTNTINTELRQWQPDNGLGFYISKNSTVNLGSEDGSKTGSLTITSPGYTNGYAMNGILLMDEGSTFNINKGSTFDFYPEWRPGKSEYNGISNTINGTINVYGKLNIPYNMPDCKGGTYINATAVINLYAGSNATFQNLIHNGTINIYGAPSGFSVSKTGGPKAWNVTGDTAKLGIYANGAFDNANISQIDLNGTLSVEIGDAEHAVSSALLPLLNFGAGGTANINFAEAAILGLKGLGATDSGEGYLNFNNFYNDMIFAEGEITIENGAIQLASGMEIVLEAYDLAGNFIDGEWSVKKVGDKYFLNNSAASPCPIPEPATCATIFGALALLTTFYRKNRK